jgi:hypothetical protein
VDHRTRAHPCGIVKRLESAPFKSAASIPTFPRLCWANSIMPKRS